jgi:tetratricopeptide (TPR) repeat protein
VYEGVCPNFFIPENNMFLSNIHGEAQKRLFSKLFCLYEKGLASLLHSPSLRLYILNVLYNPRLSICTDEHALVSEIDFDEEMFCEVFKHSTLPSAELQVIMKYLNAVDQLISSPLTQYQVPLLQALTASTLHSAAFTLQNMYSNFTANKLVYIADKMSCHMLKLAAKFGFISDRLYLAMYYYKTLRYTEALSVIEMTKVNLAQPYVMYMGRADTERYTEDVGGQSWSTKLRNAVAWDIKLHNRIIYINELMTEQMVSLQNRCQLMVVPVQVLLHMLEFLCCRHIDPMRAQTALTDLQVLLHYGQGLYVNLISKDISWQILGICQQISGDLQAALYSYQQSLGQYPSFKIQRATLMRIHELG